MILSFKKFDNLLLYLSLKVGVNFMNSQHLRLKWHFEKLDKYGPRTVRLDCAYFTPPLTAAAYSRLHFRQGKAHQTSLLCALQCCQVRGFPAELGYFNTVATG